MQQTRKAAADTRKQYTLLTPPPQIPKIAPRRNVAQRLGHLLWEQEIGGSSPLIPTPASLAQLDRASAF